MAQTLPPWAIGRDVLACTLTPQTINATSGVLADTTPVLTLFGHLDGIEVVSRATTENISPMNSLQENHVFIETGTEYRFTEIEKATSRGASRASLLAQAAYAVSSSYFKVILNRGGEAWTGFALFTEYSSRMSKNRVMGEGRFMPVDVNGVSGTGTANPIYPQ